MKPFALQIRTHNPENCLKLLALQKLSAGRFLLVFSLVLSGFFARVIKLLQKVPRTFSNWVTHPRDPRDPLEQSLEAP